MTANTAVAGQRITAAWLNTNIPGAWAAITGANSWTNHAGGTANFQARLFNSVTVEVIGEIGGGTVASGTTVGTLPAGMIPASVQRLSAEITLGTGVGTSFEMTVNASGVISLSSTITGATVIAFHFFVSLDA